jgi:hypothetical protein
MNIDNLTLFAGDTWTWTESLSGFPVDEYTAKVVLKLNGANPVIINASIADGLFTFNYSSAQTSVLTPGLYFYQYVAVKSGLDYYSASGYVQIRGNVSLAATDMRGKWRQIYDNLMTAYNSMIAAGKVEVSVSINGRSVTYDRANLIKEIQYAEMKAREEQGKGGFQTVAINFTRR